jgi:outer membrane murein-binding lipoprotein Lpp
MKNEIVSSQRSLNAQFEALQEIVNALKEDIKDIKVFKYILSESNE